MPQNPGTFTPDEVERMARAKEGGRGGIGLYNSPPAPQVPQSSMMTRALSGLKGLFGGLQLDGPPPIGPGRDIYLPLGPDDTIDPRLKGPVNQTPTPGAISMGGPSPYGR